MQTIEEKPKKLGRPLSVGATIKTTFLIDPERMNALNALADETLRSRNSLLREAIDDLIVKHKEK